MGYIDKTLMDGETVIYRTRLHWFIFYQPVLFVVAFALCIYQGSQPNAAEGFWALAFFFFVFSIYSLISTFIRFKTSEFAVTDKRVILKTGFIKRNSLELLLAKTESIAVDQGIIARIFGFGSITVCGTGGSKNPFHKIDAPFEFRKKVQEQLEKTNT